MRWPLQPLQPFQQHNSNHLSVNQWIRSAIRDSQQPTSPIGFLFWNFRHRLVRYYWYNIYIHTHFFPASTMGSQQFLYILISWHSRMDSIDENTSKLGHLEWHCWKQIGSNNFKQVCIPERVPCMCCPFKARVKMSQSHCAVAWNCRKYATPAIVQEYFRRLKHHHGIKTATPVHAAHPWG